MKSEKADEDKLNSLHSMVAEEIARLLRVTKGDIELSLKVIREARGFLKDNDVKADMEFSLPLRRVENEIVVAELPFEVEDGD